MSRYVFNLPDLGEGTVSSEIVAWRVQVGQVIREDDPLLEMSTEKAVVDVPAPVSGRILSLSGSPGDVVAVGAELVVIETEDSSATTANAEVRAPSTGSLVEPARSVEQDTTPSRVKASPSTRRRARLAGVDIGSIRGSGPGGRIRREDLDRALGQQRHQVATSASSSCTPAVEVGNDILEEVPVIGVRRVIAQRMALSKREIPHFSYVEEVDVTELEALRGHLNSRRRPDELALTYLPFLALALTQALAVFPQVNARYDSARDVVVRYRAVHLGIATQTGDGLKVPVLRAAETRTLRDLAAEIARVAELARSNRARREELSGSTITMTSLGKLGGIASTPVINAPEVAIVGVNRAVERPVVRDGSIVIRRIMNLSSSFDHRFVDGFDAAAFVQHIKDALEHPALLFAG